ncbi:MAG: PAS domain S-box protein, partial [Candidatus Marinimicrobia bacterium]|nr:PAS domain S-box protein [Candidatus Neomarinimicrobiota bacterium]
MNDADKTQEALKAAYQQLRASEQQLRAANQQLEANNQQLIAGEQQLKTSNQQLMAGEQQLRAANQQLIASESGLKIEKEFSESLLETANAFILTLDKDANIILFNKFAEKLTGYKKKDVLGKNWFDLFIPKRNGNVIPEVFQDVLKEMPTVSSHENLILCKDGSEKLIDWKNTVLKDKNGKTSGVLSIGVDITEKKQIEKELTKLSTAVKQSPSIIVITDLDGNIEYVNSKFTEITGYSSKEALGEKPRILKSGELPDKIYSELWNTISNGKEWHGEFYNKTKDGTFFWEAASISPIFDKQGKIINYLKVAEDITERKQLEQGLKESEDRLSKTMIAANDGMWDWDLIGNKVYFDPRYYKMAGYVVDEFPHEFEEFQKRIHPDDVENVMVQAQQHLEGKLARFNIEFRFKKKSGDWLWVLGRGLIVERDENNKPLRFIGTHADITKRKQAENKLKILNQQLDTSNQRLRAREQQLRTINQQLIVSEERFKKLSNLTFEGILIHDKGVLIDVNESLQKMFNYTKEELIGRNIIELLIPTEFHKIIKENIVKNVAKPYELMAKKKDGTLIPIEIEAKDIIEKDKTIRVAAIRDITERKEAEDKIKESETKLRNVFENSTNIFYSYTADHIITYFSSQIKNLLGYTPEEAMVKWAKLTSANPINEIGFQNTIKAIKTGEPQAPYELELVHKNGQKVMVEVREAPIVKDGKTVSIVGALIDITKRKQAENKLMESELRYKALHNASFGGIAIHDKGVIIECNLGLSDITGYSYEELIGMDGLML